MVTPLVKPVKPPRTPAENEETLFTTDAANDEPGMVGMETVGRPPPPVPTAGAEPSTVPPPVDTVVEGRVKVGS